MTEAVQAVEPGRCAKCGRIDPGQGWPWPRLCVACAPKSWPCPFCGSWGAVWFVKDSDDGEAWVECAVCKARGPRVPLEGLALGAWNRRKAARLPGILETELAS
jgi:hypothetical protein